MGLEHLDDTRNMMLLPKKKRKATNVSWPSVFGACQRNSTEMRKKLHLSLFFRASESVLDETRCWNGPFVMSQSARVCDNTNGGLTELIIPFQTRVKYNIGSFPEIYLFF